MKKWQISGFTLTELLVVAPIVMLVIATFVVFIVEITGEVIKTRASVDALDETQTALKHIRSDVKLSTGFIETTGVVSTPQGSDNGTAAWTNTGAVTDNQPLILTRLATDKSTLNPEKTFIYPNAPNSCVGGNEDENTPYTYYSVYFLDTTTHILWQRNILPGYPTILTSLCSTPWQLPSCESGQTAAVCKADDLEVARNISSFDVTYVDSAGTQTSIRSAAVGVEISIGTSRTVAGQTITSTDELRVAKRGSTISSGESHIGYSFGSSAPTTPIFHWSSISGATSYGLRHRIGTGSWTTVADTTNTTYTYNGSEAFRNQTVTLEVTAKNGASVISSRQATATIPAWNDCVLQNGWYDYGSGFAGAQFTKTSQGVVMFRGLIRAGTIPSNVCVLPDGFKPSYTTWFQNYSNSAIGRVDVYADRVDSYDGVVRAEGGNGAWFSLNDIRYFVPPASPCDTWKNASTPLSNSWSNYNNGFAPLRATKDCIGRVFLEGLLVPGTATSNTTISDLSAGPLNTTYRPAIHTHLTTGSYSGGYIANALHILDTGPLQARGTASSYQSAQVMYYPTGIGTWTTLPLASPWTAFSAYYTPQYTKSSDGIVSIRGLANNNANTCAGGSTIANLPVGYRPSSQLLFSAMYGSTGGVRIDVSSSGQIICYSTLPASTNVSLNQIQFIADQ